MVPDLMSCNLKEIECRHSKLNPQVKAGSSGFWVSYNVCNDTGPIKEMGRVYWVVDNFGNLVMTDEVRMSVFFKVS